jgi:hypothetical protein
MLLFVFPAIPGFNKDRRKIADLSERGVPCFATRDHTRKPGILLRKIPRFALGGKDAEAGQRGQTLWAGIRQRGQTP